MTNIKYVGRSDARVLDAADLAKGDVEGFRKTVFQRNVPTEVSEEAAEAILRVPEIYGEFTIVTEETEAKGKAKTETATDSGAASTSTTPATRPSGRASTAS